MEVEAPPRFRWVPPRDGSMLRGVEAVAGKIGRSLDPAQRIAVDTLTSAWSNGKPATLEACVIAARQNLKTYVIEDIVLTRLLRPAGDRLVVWSAHEVSTAQETFATFLELAERFPWLGQQVVAVSRSTGRESITFQPEGSKTTRRLRFRARIKTGGRGLAGDLIVLDEAFALQPAHMGSLIPILSTRPRAQVIYGSSAPLESSDVLRAVIERGRAGGAGAPAYVEWSSPGSLKEPPCADGKACTHVWGVAAGCALDDERLWLQANPAAAYGRITMEYLRDERRALPPVEFARERLGWGEDAGGSARRPITVEAWRRLKNPAPIDGPPAFGIAVAHDQSYACIAVAGQSGSVVQVEIPTGCYAQGIRWVADRARKLADRWPSARFGVVPNTAAKVVIGALTDAGVPLDEIDASGWVEACGLLADGVNGDPPKLAHHGDPVLDVAVRAAETRPRGDGGWIWWQADSSADIAPLCAATLAYSLSSGAYDVLDSVPV